MSPDEGTPGMNPDYPAVQEWSVPRAFQTSMAHAAVARYTAWVESYPDEDPTPLRVRQRIRDKAIRNLEQLGE